MLIGMGGQKKAEGGAAAADAAPSAHIFDAGMQDFEARVIAASMHTPVLVDFWAPWCGPCKQLAPVLEQAVKDANGKVLLAKINIDDNPELAQALRVQSVPTVYAFFQGQPVTAFQGARPASDIKTLIDQLVKMAQAAQPDALDIPAVLAQAASLLAEGKFAQAQDLYVAVLGQEEENAPAYAGIVRTLIGAGEPEQAKEMLENAPDAIKTDAAFTAAKAAVELAAHKPDDSVIAALQQKLAQDANDHAARFDLAMAQFAGGRAEEAMDNLLDIMRRDRAWEDDKARLQLLKFFEALGPADPQTQDGRRKLSSLLFS
jgi:putative thioredoxin